MNKLITVTLSMVLATCLYGSPSKKELIDRFEQNYDLFFELAQTFEAQKERHPDFRGIDLKYHSPMRVQLREEELKRQRDLMTDLKLTHLTDGRLLNHGLKSPIYFIHHVKDEEHGAGHIYSTFTGYLKAEGDPATDFNKQLIRDEFAFINLEEISEGWFFYQWKAFSMELDLEPFEIE
ncbi:hypothetical protein [Pelagicoccus sp. SDUM812003]|uniref:hypothetical protein n=1 Tax=Pelagicoccus sp. SDUM812003 TaxID=3041267 RepID=UPI0028108A47|nr:hypothetical protein [Pelagicoccus sp. SDUM812003]MDQ8205772.1 hypothetical protein [Pelagicoccus sp. SDUM812003]